MIGTVFLFIIPILLIFLAIFIVLGTIPFLTSQYFNFELYNKILLKANPETELSGYWTKWFGNIEIPNNLVITIINGIIIFLLTLSFLIIIIAIRNYQKNNRTILKYRIIAILLFLAILLIILVNLLFFNFYTLYIISGLLLISILFLRIPLGKFKEEGIELEAEPHALETFTLNDDLPIKNNLNNDKTLYETEAEETIADDWINNFKNQNQKNKQVKTEINLSKSEPKQDLHANFNFFKGKIDLNFLDDITYSTLEEFIMIEFSHFKKQNKNIEPPKKPIKDKDLKLDKKNSFIDQLNDLIKEEK